MFPASLISASERLLLGEMYNCQFCAHQRDCNKLWVECETEGLVCIGRYQHTHSHCRCFQLLGYNVYMNSTSVYCLNIAMLSVTQKDVFRVNVLTVGCFVLLWNVSYVEELKHRNTQLKIYIWLQIYFIGDAPCFTRTFKTFLFPVSILLKWYLPCLLHRMNC